MKIGKGATEDHLLLRLFTYKNIGIMSRVFDVIRVQTQTAGYICLRDKDESNNAGPARRKRAVDALDISRFKS